MMTSALEKRFQILGAIVNGRDPETEFSPREIATESGVSYPTVNGVLKDLTDDRLLIQVKHGWYRYTELLKVLYYKLVEFFELYYEETERLNNG